MLKWALKAHLVVSRQERAFPLPISQSLSSSGYERSRGRHPEGLANLNGCCSMCRTLLNFMQRPLLTWQWAEGQISTDINKTLQNKQRAWPELYRGWWMRNRAILSNKGHHTGTWKFVSVKIGERVFVLILCCVGINCAVHFATACQHSRPRRHQVAPGQQFLWLVRKVSDADVMSWQLFKRARIGDLHTCGNTCYMLRRINKNWWKK